MRFKDKKQYTKSYNMSKIKNILNKCDCNFIALLDKNMKKIDKSGICKYIVFDDATFHSIYTIEYKKLGYNNIIKVLNKKDEEDGTK